MRMELSTEPVRIVFLDRETLSPETRLREPAFPHTWMTYARTAPEEVVERIRDAEIVIINKVRLNAAAIAAAERLRFIAEIGRASCRERV